jgi:hypothetical protein
MTVNNAQICIRKESFASNIHDAEDGMAATLSAVVACTTGAEPGLREIYASIEAHLCEHRGRLKRSRSLPAVLLA